MGKIKLTLPKALPYILTIGGLIGVYCAFILSQDKVRLLENPNLKLSCSLDPVLACGSVITSNQGHAFGFPNPFLGLAGFAAVATIGVTIFAGAKFKRWFWLAMEAGLVFALGFVHWLFFQSVYSIGNLCIYCMVVWVVTITSFWYVTLYNIDNKYIKLPRGRTQSVYGWIRKHHLDLLVLWFLIIAALILNHFWYYYGRYFGA
ncbi:MAG: vitamin K epoxide reductase family protein [Candidatus Saccharimonadales bacterium]